MSLHRNCTGGRPVTQSNRTAGPASASHPAPKPKMPEPMTPMQPLFLINIIDDARVVVGHQKTVDAETENVDRPPVYFHSR